MSTHEEAITAALVALAEAGVPVDVQEFLIKHKALDRAIAAYQAALSPTDTATAGLVEREALYARDDVWAMFYRDGMNLGDIAKKLGASVYDLSPWLTAPLVRSALTTHPEAGKGDEA